MGRTEAVVAAGWGFRDRKFLWLRGKVQGVVKIGFFPKRELWTWHVRY